jgi:hypothetical protein
MTELATKQRIETFLVAFSKNPNRFNCLSRIGLSGNCDVAPVTKIKLS